MYNNDDRPGRVEDYTFAFLVITGVIVFMVLWVVAALMGTIAMLLLAAGLDVLFRFVGRFVAK